MDGHDAPWRGRLADPPATVASKPNQRDQKALLQRAAELEGRSVTDYVISSVQDAAKRTVEAHEVIVLSAASSRAFVDALLDPAPVNERLKDSFRRYRAATRG